VAKKRRVQRKEEYKEKKNTPTTSFFFIDLDWNGQNCKEQIILDKNTEKTHLKWDC